MAQDRPNGSSNGNAEWLLNRYAIAIADKPIALPLMSAKRVEMRKWSNNYRAQWL